MVEQARKLCLLGATDQEVADFVEVSTRTICRWKASHDEFCQALKAGKAESDARGGHDAGSALKVPCVRSRPATVAALGTAQTLFWAALVAKCLQGR